MDPQATPTNAAPGISLPPVQPAAPQPSPVPAAVPAVPPAPAPPAQVTTEDATPLIADDADLIEKAWVEKAKQLVDKTKSDPYTQNKEINKFKATYIKKRYNKDVQLSKD